MLRTLPGIFKTQRCLARASLTRSYSLAMEEDEVFKDAARVTIGSQEFQHEPLRISACLDGGFQFKNIQAFGPVFIHRSALLRWNVKKFEEITLESLILPSIIHPKPDLIILGTGNKIEHLNPDLIRSVNALGAKLMVEDTKNACGTYNLLMEQQQYHLVACLIPISKPKQHILIGSKKDKELPKNPKIK